MQTAMAPIAFAAMCGQTAVVQQFLKLNDLDVSLHAVSFCMSVNCVVAVSHNDVSYSRLHSHSHRLSNLSKDNVQSY